VSSKKQQKYFNSFLDAMRTFCLANGVAVDSWITEIAGGMNFKRPKFKLSVISHKKVISYQLSVILHMVTICVFFISLRSV